MQCTYDECQFTDTFFIPTVSVTSSIKYHHGDDDNNNNNKMKKYL